MISVLQFGKISEGFLVFYIIKKVLKIHSAILPFPSTISVEPSHQDMTFSILSSVKLQVKMVSVPILTSLSDIVTPEIHYFEMQN